jgi:hypothetical protein
VQSEKIMVEEVKETEKKVIQIEFPMKSLLLLDPITHLQPFMMMNTILVNRF